MAENGIEFVVGVEEGGMRLDQFLAGKRLPHSRSQIQRRIEEGEVLVNGATARPSKKLRPGDRVLFSPPPPVPTALVPEEMPLTVFYEDQHLIVLDKPAGLVVHPAAGHASGTLVNALLARCGDLGGIGGELRPGIVHRLDRDTSGLMVVAKDEPTLLGLQDQFRHHTLRRSYVAIVDGEIETASGRFATLYGRHPVHRKRFTSRVTTGKVAITNYTVVERLEGATLVRVRLETGRTHQIRVHFREHGHPVVGDPVYGRPSKHPLVREVATMLGRQALHAYELGFRHPVTGEDLVFESPWPEDFRAAAERLRRR